MNIVKAAIDLPDRDATILNPNFVVAPPELQFLSTVGRRASRYSANAIARMAPALAPRSIIASWNLFGVRVSPVTLIWAPIARITPRSRDRRDEQERLQGRCTLLQIRKHCPQYFHDDHYQQQIVDQRDDRQVET